MKRRLIIDGNAVYELDEDCMLKKRLDKGKEKREEQLAKNQTERQKKKNESWEIKKDKGLWAEYKNMDKVNKKQMRKLWKIDEMQKRIGERDCSPIKRRGHMS